MNIWRVFAGLPAVVAAVKDLADRIIRLHDNPKFAALVASDPAIKAESDAISKDVRDVQNALR